MTVAYDVTIKDVVEIYQKTTMRLKTWQQLANRRRLGMSLLNAFNAFVIFNIAVTELDINYTDMTFALNVVAVIAASAITASVWIRFEEWSLRRNLRRLVREYFKEDDTTEFRVTLAEKGIEISMLGSETTYSWSSVETIDILNDRTEVWLALDTLLTVLDRGFARLEEKQKFVALLHQFSQMSPHK